MEILVFLFVFFILIIYLISGVHSHSLRVKEEEIIKEEQRKRIALLESITQLDRGTPAERDLILTLLDMGIHPHAIFHDLYLYRENKKFSQIDLVAATKVGIIVFEVKDYSGWIYGKGNQAKWTQVLSYGQEKNKFYNPIMQNKNHIKYLREKLKENVPFYSVIVFYGSSELKDISFIPYRTYITKWYRVSDVIDSIIKENPLASYQNKEKVVKFLKEAVNNGNKKYIEEKHIKEIKDMLGTERIFQ